MLRFPDVQRMVKVGDGVLLGASGEISDFQYIVRLLDRLR
jgi:20S proteasome alpha/beta subunit